MTKAAQREIIGLFVQWKVGKANKWDVYPRCFDLMKAKKVSKKFIIRVAEVICNIKKPVVNDRLRYMRQLDKQVVIG